jgi:hypothetical protein
MIDDIMRAMPDKIRASCKEIGGRWASFSGFSESAADGIEVVSTRNVFNDMFKRFEPIISAEWLRLRRSVMEYCIGKGAGDYFTKEVNLLVAQELLGIDKRNMPKKFITDKRIGMSLTYCEEVLVWRSICFVESGMASDIDANFPHQGIPCGWTPRGTAARGVLSVYRP